jgi:hypothetical protein
MVYKPQSVAVSADGQYIVSIINTNFWPNLPPPAFAEQGSRNPSGVYRNINELLKYKQESYATIKISRDSGINWDDVELRDQWFSCVSMSNNGQHILIGCKNTIIDRSTPYINPGFGGSNLFLSHDYGFSWEKININKRWDSVQISDNGQYLMAAGERLLLFDPDRRSSYPQCDVCDGISGDPVGFNLNKSTSAIFVSHDSGNNWFIPPATYIINGAASGSSRFPVFTQQPGDALDKWLNIVMTRNGKYGWALSNYYNYLYTEDYGASWEDTSGIVNPTPVREIEVQPTGCCFPAGGGWNAYYSISDDGKYQIVSKHFNRTWTSKDSGVSWNFHYITGMNGGDLDSLTETRWGEIAEGIYIDGQPISSGPPSSEANAIASCWTVGAVSDQGKFITARTPSLSIISPIASLERFGNPRFRNNWNPFTNNEGWIFVNTGTGFGGTLPGTISPSNPKGQKAGGFEPLYGFTSVQRQLIGLFNYYSQRSGVADNNGYCNNYWHGLDMSPNGNHIVARSRRPVITPTWLLNQDVDRFGRPVSPSWSPLFGGGFQANFRPIVNVPYGLVEELYVSHDGGTTWSNSYCNPKFTQSINVSNLGPPDGFQPNPINYYLPISEDGVITPLEFQLCVSGEARQTGPLSIDFLPFTYSTSDDNIASIRAGDSVFTSNSGILTIKQTGTFQIFIGQSGNNEYFPTSYTKTINVISGENPFPTDPEDCSRIPPTDVILDQPLKKTNITSFYNISSSGNNNVVRTIILSGSGLLNNPDFGSECISWDYSQGECSSLLSLPENIEKIFDSYHFQNIKPNLFLDKNSTYKYLVIPKDASTQSTYWTFFVTPNCEGINSQAIVTTNIKNPNVNSNYYLQISDSNSFVYNSKLFLSEPKPVDSFNLIKFSVDGLNLNTKYFARLLNSGFNTVGNSVASFSTPGEGSFKFAFASCSTSNLNSASNAIIYDNIANKAINNELDFFIHLGDMHYRDIATNNEADFHKAFDDVFNAPRQNNCWKNLPMYYMWDDHDYGPNDTDKNNPSRQAAIAAYRRRVPHPELAKNGPEDSPYYSFIRGRVRFIVTDIRSEREPKGTYPSNSQSQQVFSPQQKEWFFNELLTAKDNNQIIIWANTKPWVSSIEDGKDDWGGYHAARLEIVNFINQNNLNNRIVIISGDMHALAYDDGSSFNNFGNLKVCHAAALDQTGSSKGGPYTLGPIRIPPNGSVSQYGIIEINDSGGQSLNIRFKGISVDRSESTESIEIDVNFNIGIS